jgi:hypothetical protein
LKKRKPSFLQKVFCPRKIALSNAKDLLLFFKLGQPFFNYGWLGFVSRKVAVHVLSEKWLSTFSGPFKCQGLASFL